MGGETSLATGGGQAVTGFTDGPTTGAVGG